MAQRVQTVKKLKESLENYLSLSGMYEQARNTYYLWIYAASRQFTADSDPVMAAKEVLAGYEGVFIQNLSSSSYYSHQRLSVNQLHNLTYYRFLQEAENHICNIYYYEDLEDLVNFDIAEFIFSRVLESQSPLLAAYTVLHLVNGGVDVTRTLRDVRQKQLYYISRKRNH